MKKLLFVLLALATLLPWVTPAIALGAGIVLALTLGNPMPRESSRWSKKLLQACVVGLGFGMPLAAVVRAGAAGVGYTIAGIATAIALGLLIGRWLRVHGETSVLITAGTSICGGSAIAAVGPAIGAREESMGIALATVFVLNAVALYLFPPIGHLLGLTQRQFAVWAAIAIHDTSSVVGAATQYGPEALQRATVLKLARALWIVPLTFAAAAWARRRGDVVAAGSPASSAGSGASSGGSAASSAGSGASSGGSAASSAGSGASSGGSAASSGGSGASSGGSAASSGGSAASSAAASRPKVSIPWFIGLFLLAAVARTLLPTAVDPALDIVARAARAGLALTLFLIGAGLTRAVLRRVGTRPMVQGVMLWGAVASLTLFAVYRWVAP